eukprot:CAMPEP_0170607260 /NCGR_PEP_ID=MMETSP0224-20130122/20957_1 /TAXON_ID=285029 /ORGANISM="Togula jolla, Strain CCCM 725" /LENGTH=585 /DNA_ID=CAMNT_0010932409 /DNA_START=51 /DNA_END=1808 /DNA_ORIENTATION=-
MSTLRRGKPQTAKELPEEVRPRAAVSAVGDKPKSSEGPAVSAWGKPRDGTAPRSLAPSSSSTNGVAKTSVKAAGGTTLAKTPVNIAALAARNLGGFVPNKIFVGGVPITCTEEQFKSYFEPFGAISKVELHALRGFGYITYESVEAVDACLEKYEDHYLSKKWVEVKRSIPRELIESYEREQRRLHAEFNRDGVVSVESEAEARSRPRPPSGTPTAAPTAPADAPTTKVDTPAPASNPSAWQVGAAPSRAPQKGVKEPPGKAVLSRIRQLTEMGFSEEVAKRVLSECVWDVNQAIDRLLTDESLSAEPPVGGGSSTSVAASPADDLDVAEAAPTGPSASLPPEAPPASQKDTGAGSGSLTESPPSTTSPAIGAVGDAGCGGAGGNSLSPSPAVSQEKQSPELQAQPGTGELLSADGGSKEMAEQKPVQWELGGSDVHEVSAREATSSAAPSPQFRKRIERVLGAWSAEDSSQISVAENEFVNIWVDTGTDHGWIHAERRSGDAQVGWLPASLLQKLPDTQRWMITKQKWQAMDETQSNVEEGTMVIVWIMSRTPEGWTYAEVETEKGGPMQPGWLPDFCLEWCED